MIKSYKFIVSGKVQGVYYRVSIQKSAKALKYMGYVKNLPDKTVMACVTCEESDLPSFIEILKKGSSSSRVDSIKESKCDEIFTKEFTIR